jgi:hypothetical protein
VDCSREEALALAAQTCSICFGLGIRPVGERHTCRCVLRRIFRICYERFHECAFQDDPVSREFVADFCNVSRRALTEGENRLFRFHFLLAAGPRLCWKRLNMDRGAFYHSVYRVEEKTGVFFHLHGLYPLHDYFPPAPSSEHRTAGDLIRLHAHLKQSAPVYTRE